MKFGKFNPVAASGFGFAEERVGRCHNIGQGRVQRVLDGGEAGARCYIGRHRGLFMLNLQAVDPLPYSFRHADDAMDVGIR